MRRAELFALVARYWRAVLSRSALPMLALAASYGVYQYARLYVPDWVAFVQAAAFELTYLGLAVARNVDTRRARRISAGAVVTSIIYNTLAGLFHRVPLDAFALPLAGELAFAALHGLPLAWVAYLVADLMLHTSAQAVPHPAPIVSHRPAQVRRLVRRLVAEVRRARAHPRPTVALEVVELAGRRVNVSRLAREMGTDRKAVYRLLDKCAEEAA